MEQITGEAAIVIQCRSGYKFTNAAFTYFYVVMDFRERVLVLVHSACFNPSAENKK